MEICIAILVAITYVNGGFWFLVAEDSNEGILNDKWYIFYPMLILWPLATCGAFMFGAIIQVDSWLQKRVNKT